MAYDPAKISYEAIMEKCFAQAHGGASKPQYMSAVWAQDEEQAAIAKAVAERTGKADVPILPVTDWHDAEEYHQHYYAKQARRLPARLQRQR